MKALMLLLLRGVYLEAEVAILVILRTEGKGEFWRLKKELRIAHFISEKTAWIQILKISLNPGKSLEQ